MARRRGARGAAERGAGGGGHQLGLGEAEALRRGGPATGARSLIQLVWLGGENNNWQVFPWLGGVPAE